MTYPATAPRTNQPVEKKVFYRQVIGFLPSKSSDMFKVSLSSLFVDPCKTEGLLLSRPWI